jgi:hypothetical protein
MTLQQNYELHQKLTDEKHWSVGWDVTHLFTLSCGEAGEDQWHSPA